MRPYKKSPFRKLRKTRPADYRTPLKEVGYEPISRGLSMQELQHCFTSSGKMTLLIAFSLP